MLFFDQLWLEFVQFLHRLQGRIAAQSGLRELLIVQPDVVVQRSIQFLARLEVVALQRDFYPTFKALKHPVGVRLLRRRQAMFDIKSKADFVERVHTCRGSLAMPKVNR